MPRRCPATPIRERDRARLIDDEMRAAGLVLAAGRARAADPACSAATAQASRSEIRKLALYARGRGEVGVDDVDRGGVRRLGAGARRHRRCGVCRPPGRARNATGEGAHRRQRGRIDPVRRPAPGRAVAQMAHRDRSGRAVLARCRAAAAAFPPQGARRSGAQGVERRAPCSRRWPSLPTPCWNRGARRRSPTPLPSARCCRSPQTRGAARRESAGEHRSDHCGRARGSRAAGQSASLLRPTTDILAAAAAITS